MSFGRREPFKCIETGDIFITKAEAAKHFNISVSSVNDSIRDGRPHMGYTFVYVADLSKVQTIDYTQPDGDWVDIPGYEGLYQITPAGLVWSVPRIVDRCTGRPNVIRGKLLNVTVDAAGYCSVALTDSAHKTKKYLLHRLVAQTFIPNPRGYKYVDHKDRNPKNNAVSNLEWVAQSVSYSRPKQVHTHIDSKLSTDQLREVQDLLGEHFNDSGEWKFASIDSTLDYAICSSGKYLIQLSGKNRRNANISPKIIKFALTKDGYLRCSHGLLHRIVAEAFLSDWDEDLTVNHIDGDKLNNDISNLEMLPNAENIRHYFTSPIFEDSRNVRISSIKTKLTGRPGKPASAETREKWRQAALGHRLSEEQRYKLSQSRRRWWEIHGESFRANHPQNGKRYITNGSICKLVTAQDAESYIQSGWTYGMKQRGS